jgi:hypothetical protein
MLRVTNTNKILEERSVFKMSNSKKFHVLRGTNFGMYEKERALYVNLQKRVKQGKAKICENFKDMIYLIKFIRKLPKYQEWLNSNNQYGFNCDTDEYNETSVYFGKIKTTDKGYARINKYTKKVEYFSSQSELTDVTGYCSPKLLKHIKSGEPLDGYYICYIKDLHKFI